MKNRLISFIKRYPDKYTREYDPETKWGEPLVKVAAADDPLFEERKTIISPTHALPEEMEIHAANAWQGFLVP